MFHDHKNSKLNHFSPISKVVNFWVLHLLAVTLNGVRMARHIGHSAASVVCIGCGLFAMERGLYICLPSESSGPNLLDETFERLHNEPCQPP